MSEHIEVGDVVELDEQFVLAGHGNGGVGDQCEVIDIVRMGGEALLDLYNLDHSGYMAAAYPAECHRVGYIVEDWANE